MILLALNFRKHWLAPFVFIFYLATIILLRIYEVTPLVTGRYKIFFLILVPAIFLLRLKAAFFSTISIILLLLAPFLLLFGKGGWAQLSVIYAVLALILAVILVGYELITQKDV